MGYYANSMYRGDYYRGRGDFWSGLKGIAGAVLPTVGAAVGTIFGPAGTAIGGMAGNVLSGVLTPSPSPQSAMPGGAMMASAGSAIVRAAKNPKVRGAAAAIGTGMAMEAASSFFGGGGGGRKRRSMNAANVHALRRAMRRVESFQHLAKKSGACPTTHRRAPARRAAACCK